MRKCTTIAKCLVNAGFTRDLREAENVVQRIFDTRFPGQNFATWDKDIGDRAAENFINRVAGSTTIYVKHLIQSL